MSDLNIKKRIEKLKKEVEYHRHLYHVLDKSEISDEALDSLKKELFDLEVKYPEFKTKDSPSERVAGKVLDKFQKVNHSFPVLSLQDVFSMEDFLDWEDRNRKIVDTKYDYFCELKLDGLTVVLTYENGLFVGAATRGDGKVGEDVTNNIKTIESIPLKLNDSKIKTPNIFTVRGEVVLKKSYFEKINKERVAQGLPEFANPRNIAAGSIRQLDPSVVRERELVFFAYYFDEDLRQRTHEETHKVLQDFGFKINPNNEYCKTVVDVKKYLDKWQEKRKKLDYMTDGVVVVTNDINIEKKLGSVGKTERWMVAYKFPPEQVTSKVLDVIIQVGRTGVLTPVAILEPKNLAGSIVSRATLHNFDEIGRLGLRIGDTVILQKAGDVIPDIVEVLTKLRIGKEKVVVIPHECPVCKSSISKKDNEVNYYCSNKSCYATLKENIIHFVSKKAFNIDGLGQKIVEKLMEEALLEDVSDIFKLTKDELIPLERFADKSVDNLLKAINDSKDITFSRFIYSLGIRHIGEEMSIILAKRFGNITNLINAKPHEFDNIYDIGPAVSASLYEYFNDKKNIKLINELVKCGVNIQSNTKSKNTKLEGRSFVFSGGLESISRDDAKNIVRDLGGKISSSVSSKTDYLILGDEPGSKYEKAQKLGVKILEEEEFKKLIS